MSALTDLQAIVGTLVTDVTALITLAKANGTISDAAGESIVTQLQALDTAVQAVTNPTPPTP
jgi:hypothetical protein